MSERQDYLVHTTGGDIDLASVCQAVYDAVEDRVDLALVEAYSGRHGQLPADIVAAQNWLRRRGLDQALDDPGIGIEIHPTDETGWAITRAYTPWSHCVELFDEAKRSIAHFDDGATAVIVFLTPDEATALAESLPAGHDIEVLLQARERRHNDRKARRRRRWFARPASD